MNKDELLNKKIPVPDITFPRYEDVDSNQFIYIKKGKVELTPAALKKIKWRLENSILPDNTPLL